MAKDGERSLTPRLRFPEFRATWEEIPLKELANAVTDRAGNMPCTPYTVTSGVGLVSQEEKFGRNIAGNALKNYIRLQKNDFAYNKSSTKAFPEGYIARYRDDAKAAVPNSIFTCFRVNDRKIEPAYLDFLFASNLHGKWLRKFLAIGARAHGSLNVSDDDLMALPIPMPSGPSSFAEQRKIADCLMSLDDLIAALGRKVESLKAHKKGLVEQLFPRGDETLPRLRFPQFRTQQEWKIEPLGRIAENLDNKRVPIAEKDRPKGDVPYYGASGIVDYVNGHIFDQDLLCVSEDGANLVTRTYPIAFSISGKTWVNNHAHVLRFEDSSTQKIVEVYLNATDLRDFITGMTQPKLNRAMLDTIPIPVPELAERHRIADCFHAIDIQIAAEAGRFAALKAYEQGLMQQLFPSSEGG